MILETYPSMKETNQIGMYMLYQADTIDYIKIIIGFKKNYASRIQFYGSSAINISKTWSILTYIMKQKYKIITLRC